MVSQDKIIPKLQEIMQNYVKHFHWYLHHISFDSVILFLQIWGQSQWCKTTVKQLTELPLVAPLPWASGLPVVFQWQSSVLGT